MRTRAGAIAVMIVALAGCGGAGLKTGSPAEFCADYGVVQKSLSDFNPKTMADIDRFAAAYSDVRYPSSLMKDAESGLDAFDELKDKLDGVDFDSEEAQRIASSIDVSGLDAIEKYARDAC